MIPDTYSWKLAYQLIFVPKFNLNSIKIAITKRTLVQSFSQSFQVQTAHLTGYCCFFLVYCVLAFMHDLSLCRCTPLSRKMNIGLECSSARFAFNKVFKFLFPAAFVWVAIYLNLFFLREPHSSHIALYSGYMLLFPTVLRWHSVISM